MAKDLFKLPPAERLKRFLELATEAEAFAHSMLTPGLRDGYLTIASRWREMAAQLQRSLHGGKAETQGQLKSNPLL